MVPSLSAQWGGPPVVVTSLTRTLQAQGVDCAIFATTGRRVGTDRLPTGGIKTELFSTSPVARIWTGHSFALAKMLRRVIPSYDLVHVHELWHYPGYAAAKAARATGKPYVVTLHGGLEPWALGHKSARKRAYMTAIQRRVLSNAAILHVATREEAKQVRNHGINAPVKVIPNGVNAEEFESLPARSAVEELSYDLLGQSIVLFLGRIHPKKGLDILAKSFGEVARTRADVRLLIAGPDEAGYRANVEKMLEDAGALDKTVFVGTLTGREKLIALGSADIFVLPSYSEGFSISVLESMCSGLPVVISRQCYFPEVAEAGAGRVIDSDPGQLTDSITQLLDHPDDRKVMGERARKLIRDRYTWTSIAARFRDLYSEAIACTFTSTEERRQ